MEADEPSGGGEGGGRHPRAKPCLSHERTGTSLDGETLVKKDRWYPLRPGAHTEV